MRKIFAFVFMAVFASACGGKQEGAGLDKKAQLAALKKTQGERALEIAALEKELGGSGDSLRRKIFYISVTPAAPTTFNHYIELQGSVVADESVFVNAKAAGAVTKVYFNVGDRVTQGQVLAEIDDAMLDKQLEELQKRYELANEVYVKQEALWKQNIGSEIQLLSAKNNKESLEKAMSTIQKGREYYKITSPISGVVDEKMLQAGGVVAPGVPLAVIVNFSKLKVKAEVPESYAGKLRAGNGVLVNFPDLKKELNSKISYVGNSVNPLTRTFKVEIPLKANENGVLPNMASLIKVSDYANANVYAVPMTILKKDIDGSDFVLIENQGKAMRVSVKIGQFYGDKVEVLSGLKPGDKLITAGFEDLSDGDQVQVN
jgi:membrane fusion protein, multidrug efflux system